MPKTKPKPKSSIVYSHLAPPRTRRVRGIESRFNDVFLRSEEFSATISDPLSCDLSRTIEGASTVTVSVHDPNMVLLRSEVFDTRCDLRLDGLHFRLVSIEKQEAGVLVFTFEDREVALMRQVRGARQMSRDKVTRAEFVFSEVREVRDLPNGYKIPVYIPDLRK
jgi:hypothetical protein